MTSPQQVALVSETDKLPFEEVAVVAAALQRQVTEHFFELWDIMAIVNPYRSLEQVPTHYWPIIIVDEPDIAGIHHDDRGQPFALVSFGPSWSLAASHECLEMLVDPSGNAFRSGPAPVRPTHDAERMSPQVEYLVEICDPCEAAAYAYEVDGILVSEFYTREYFSVRAVPGMQYSYNYSITRPRQVLPGGYLTWRDPVSDKWWQLRGEQDGLQLVEFGPLTFKQRSVRSVLYKVSGRDYAHLSGLAPSDASLINALNSRRSVDQSAKSRADSLRREIDRLRRPGSP